MASDRALGGSTTLLGRALPCYACSVRGIVRGARACTLLDTMGTVMAGLCDLAYSKRA